MAGLSTSSKDYKLENIQNSSKTGSVAYWSDPDLLVREYFLSSSLQRSKSRKVVSQYISSWQSVLDVLRWGVNSKANDSYDGAVNLLAETDSFAVLEILGLIAKKLYIPMLDNESHRGVAETCLEILIKAIACAYKVEPMQRYRLIFDVIPPTNRRTIKASIIDALLIIADEIDVNTIKNALERYNFDKDQYICDYTKEALQELDLE
ncbi:MULTISPECIES: hypothetical protein [Pseudanabaena]|uniref:PBS lyase HEAT domain protein repeat-containing protein n=2 Tax=Pseudanabaena TaxID=1152 RepID=L8MWY5_9CYAN|nr:MULTISPECIES: hypothetical protein [Pseudanabaena]ELS32512.1 hypothetical protein Pse7429DRAFT_2038 [Pseudanabaena biceps PCC 7429]MDG3495247.1 hypothetical protein [Pseudanabaena catenata USMAC16]